MRRKNREREKKKQSSTSRLISKSLRVCFEINFVFRGAREVNVLKSRLSAGVGYLLTQASKVKNEVNNSAKVQAFKQKVSSWVSRMRLILGSADY